MYRLLRLLLLLPAAALAGQNTPKQIVLTQVRMDFNGPHWNEFQCTVMREDGHLLIRRRIQVKGEERSTILDRQGTLTPAQWQTAVSLANFSTLADMVQPPLSGGPWQIARVFINRQGSDQKFGYAVWGDPDGPPPSTYTEQFKLAKLVQTAFQPFEIFVTGLTAQTAEVTNVSFPEECT